MLQKQYNKTVDQEAPKSQAGKTAAYIAELTAEMEKLAKRQNIEPLSFLLQLAREEADRVSHRR